MSESEVKEDDNETEHASTANPHPVEPAKKKKKKRKKKATKQQSGGVVGQRRSSEDKSDVCTKLHKPSPFERLTLIHSMCV